MKSESLRQQKVARQLQKDLSDVFRELGVDGLSGGSGVMVSVTRVRVSSDLEHARVYVSVFPSGGSERVLQMLEERGSEVRHSLGRRIGKQMRVVPELQYFLDDSLDYIDRIDELLEGEGKAKPDAE